jgi:hypothetical protein
MNEPITAQPESNTRQVIQCANCGGDNIVGATRCHECDSHLYLVCRHCGRSNVRTFRNCSACGGRLGGSAVRRRFRRIFRRFDPLTLFVAVIVLIVAALFLLSWEKNRVPPQTDRPVVSD